METKEFKPVGDNQKQHYVPPKQGAAGQIFDSIFLLIIIYPFIMNIVNLRQVAKNRIPCRLPNIVSMTFDLVLWIGNRFTEILKKICIFEITLC